MELNKAISLIIGVIVVILILVWVGNRFRSRPVPTTSGRTVTLTPTPTKAGQRKGWDLFGFLRKPSPTPTKSLAQDTQIITPTPTRIIVTNQGQTSGTTKGGQQPFNPDYHSYSGNAVTQIPNTGAPTLLIPIVLSSLAGGIFLARSKRK